MTQPEAPVVIAPYDAAWRARFEEEAQALRDVLGAWLAGPIEHIGSTAIPGLAAKRGLAEQHHLDREAYTEAKHPFIERVTRLALEQRSTYVKPQVSG